MAAEDLVAVLVEAVWRGWFGGGGFVVVERSGRGIWRRVWPRGRMGMAEEAMRRD